MQLRHRRRHVGIALIGAHHDVARLSHTEVAARHSSPCLHELVAQMHACAACQICRVVIANLLADAFLFKHTAHFLTFQVYCRHHYMTRLLMKQLQNTLAEVGLHHVYAILFEIRIHATLLSKHRLRLHHLLHAVLLKYFEHRLVEVVCRTCPVHYHATAFKLSGKLLQIVSQMCYGVPFYLAGVLAQLFPFVQALSHLVALLSERPERSVVPRCLLSVFVEAACRFAV